MQLSNPGDHVLCGRPIFVGDLIWPDLPINLGRGIVSISQKSCGTGRVWQVECAGIDMYVFHASVIVGGWLEAAIQQQRTVLYRLRGEASKGGPIA